jgi:ribosomal protein S3
MLRGKRPPLSVVHRSSRAAGRFESGISIKQQHKTLMIQLETAREGEVIGKEALHALLQR